MNTLEYEVLFVFGSVNVTCLAFIGDDEGGGDETYSEIIIRRALDTVMDELGAGLADYDEVSIKHTGTLRG